MHYCTTTMRNLWWTVYSLYNKPYIILSLYKITVYFPYIPYTIFDTTYFLNIYDNNHYLYMFLPQWPVCLSVCSLSVIQEKTRTGRRRVVGIHSDLPLSGIHSVGTESGIHSRPGGSRGSQDPSLGFFPCLLGDPSLTVYIPVLSQTPVWDSFSWNRVSDSFPHGIPGIPDSRGSQDPSLGFIPCLVGTESGNIYAKFVMNRI